VVSRRLPTTAARVRAQVRSCWICGRQSGTGACFLRVLWFPLPILIPPTAPHPSSSISRGVSKRPVVAAVPSGLSPHCKKSSYTVQIPTYTSLSSSPFIIVHITSEAVSYTKNELFITISFPSPSPYGTLQPSGQNFSFHFKCQIFGRILRMVARGAAGKTTHKPADMNRSPEYDSYPRL
jgi:hypothetical protein